MVRDVRPWPFKDYKGLTKEDFDSLDCEYCGILCGMVHNSGQCCFDVLLSEMKPFGGHEAVEGCKLIW